MPVGADGLAATSDLDRTIVCCEAAQGASLLDDPLPTMKWLRAALRDRLAGTRPIDPWEHAKTTRRLIRHRLAAPNDAIVAELISALQDGTLFRPIPGDYKVRVLAGPAEVAGLMHEIGRGDLLPLCRTEWSREFDPYFSPVATQVKVIGDAWTALKEVCTPLYPMSRWLEARETLPQDGATPRGRVSAKAKPRTAAEFEREIDMRLSFAASSVDAWSHAPISYQTSILGQVAAALTIRVRGSPESTRAPDHPIFQALAWTAESYEKLEDHDPWLTGYVAQALGEALRSSSHPLVDLLYAATKDADGRDRNTATNRAKRERETPLGAQVLICLYECGWKKGLDLGTTHFSSPCDWRSAAKPDTQKELSRLVEKSFVARRSRGEYALTETGYRLIRDGARALEAKSPRWRFKDHPVPLAVGIPEGQKDE